MRAITLWQPWAWAISDIPEPFAKRVENRPWEPWKSLIGEDIALHAGKTYDPDAAEQILDVFDIAVPSKENIILGAVVAVVRLAGCVTESQDPWFSGPYGWLLSNVRRVSDPVPLKGAQGLWQLPSDIEEKVRQRTE